MMGQYVPMYIHLCDVLHGTKSLWFDWYTGLGNNMAGATLHFGLISPFNLFFLFIGRGSVEPLPSDAVYGLSCINGFPVSRCCFVWRSVFCMYSPSLICSIIMR